MAYDPSLIEWAVLFLFLTMGALCAASFAGSAMGLGWRQWWRRMSRRHRPPTQPQLFAVGFSVAQMMVGVAMWLLWRRASRVGDIGNGALFACMMLYLVHFLLASAAGGTLFCVGLQLGWQVCTTVLAIACSALLIALVVVMFVAGAYAAGGVMVAPAVWSVYAAVVAIVLHVRMASAKTPVTQDPMEHIEAHLETLRSRVSNLEGVIQEHARRR